LLETFYMVSLGCPKNRVDAEVIWAEASRAGLASVERPDDADVIIVNTCAFVQSAVEESLDTIVEMGRFKTRGRCQKLVVSGCLAPRYGESLLGELPEVDLFAGPAEAGQLGQWLKGTSSDRSFRCRESAGFLPGATTPRANSLSPGAAYLKVSEGCSRRCSFCLIPSLRGPMRSCSLEDLTAQTGNLVALGVREVVLVAQDLAGWGQDLAGRPGLSELVTALSDVPGLQWLRLMYLFPTEVPQKLIRTIAERKQVLPYLDIPFQHVDGTVLSRMRRGGDPPKLVAFVKRLREEVPGVVLRTSLMTGFPGETEEAFQRLVAFVEEIRFERLGVFSFSAEEGTEAAGYPDQVPNGEAERRQEELLARQQEIAFAYHRALIGETIDVLVEGRDEEGNLIGRAWNQAPEVDGQTVVSGQAGVGEIVPGKVVDAGPYDLEVEVIE
jgi:ribosomal protein S12 methylthiotransferase